jgi:hypothetical protein
MLYYTSALFGTVAIHSSLYNFYWITHGFIILTYLSTLNWMGKTVDYKFKNIVLFADRLNAHVITIALFIDSCNYELSYNIFGFYICLLYTILAYYSGLLNTPLRHSTIHLSSCLGTHLLIHEKKLQMSKTLYI